jgi:formiminoglutamase/agmatinase
MGRDTRVAFIGVPFDGAATLGWPGARYAPAEVREHLAWMRMRVQDGEVYWLDADRIVPFDGSQLIDAGDAPVVPHDLMATLDAVRAKAREETAAGRIPVVVGGDDSILFPAVAGFHDAVPGTVAIVHFDAHLDLLDGSPRQGRYSQSSGMRRALELPRVAARHSVQVGTRNFNFPASKRFLDSVGLTEIPARAVLRQGTGWVLERIRGVVRGADHLFVAVDIDVLDPAHAPGVGWHEPGGLTSRELIDLLVELAPVTGGLALNEVNPMTDQRAQTSILAANLVFQFAVAAAQRCPAPGPPAVRLLAVHALDQVPAPQEVHPARDLGGEAHGLEQGRERQVRLPAEVRADGRQRVLDPAHDRVLAAEVVQDDDRPARLGDASHLAQDRHRVGHRADDVRRQRRVELVLPEVEAGRVHHLERDLGHPEGLDLFLALLEHPLGEVDPHQVDVRRVEGKVQAGADAHLEDPALRRLTQQSHGRDAAGLEDLLEEEIVHRRVEVISSPDLPLLQRHVQIVLLSHASRGAGHRSSSTALRPPARAVRHASPVPAREEHRDTRMRGRGRRERGRCAR